jgi:glucokinase
MILAGDIGGTKSLLALYEQNGNPRNPTAEQEFPSRDYSGLEGVVEDFLKQNHATITSACFGLPGPIVNGHCETPNLPWVVDVGNIHSLFGGAVALLNDLEATGYGIPTLQDDELATLNAGQPDPQGNAALIAPGTGLGECILFRDGDGHRPSASEGGHCDFAPRTQEQIALLRWAFEHKRPRVSFDRVASGTGLPLVYEFLKETGAVQDTEEITQAIRSAPDPAAAISQSALEKQCPLCVKTLDLWVEVLGAEAGNLALKALATAGVYLGGGIPPKILPKLQDGTFLHAFWDKGRLEDVVHQMPVKVILNSRAALFGTARYALDQGL